MVNILQLAASLVICTGLYLLHRRVCIRAYAQGLDTGRQQGHITGLGEAEQHNYQAGYAQGHEDGLIDGRAKARAESDIASHKSYEQGYADAVQEMLNETYAAMRAQSVHESMSA